jgi:hypothetical protein
MAQVNARRFLESVLNDNNERGTMNDEGKAVYSFRF